MNEEIALYGNKDTRIDYVSIHSKENSELIDIVLLAFYVFTGIYHLLLFWKRPKEKYNLYYGLFGVLIGSYLFFQTNYIFQFQIEYLLQFKIELLLLFATALAMFTFFELFLSVGKQNITIIYGIFILILSLAVVVSNRAYATKVLFIFQLSGFVMLGLVCYFMILAIKNNHPEARSLVIGFIILLFAIVADLIGAMHIIENYENQNFTRYGFFSFVIGIAVVLANRFLRVHKEVEELNENLEKKVKERTKQLAESLEKLENLKKQKDGDYFLTSLLIKPLMRNEVKSDKFKIKFFIRQKKQFEFKNKTHEIGGDICISNSIVIRGKKYIAFRRRKWNGLFINAEHPWVVLYMDGKASFIEDSLSIRKIGMTGLEGTLSVKTYQLQKGDSLILGSDGRDDILLKLNELGQRVINKDETLFLKHVEKGQGDLEKITQFIQETGELTDDYTLVKITYLGEAEKEIDQFDQEKFFELVAKVNHSFEEKDHSLSFYKEAHSLYPKDKNVLQKLVHIYFGAKNYKKTIDYCKKYLHLEPRDSEYLFILSSCFKLNNQIYEAVDVGEALRLRKLNNVKNLINLADCYRIEKNYSKAEKILSYALAIDGENEKALKLKSLLLKEHEG